MKAILEFNLPEDKDEFQFANQGLKYFCALNDIRQELRNKLKHGELSEAEYTCYEFIQEMFFNAIQSNNINLDEF